MEPLQISAKAEGAPASDAPQVEKRATMREALRGNPRREGSRTRWQRQVAPPPAPSRAEKKVAQHAAEGAGVGLLGGSATCGRHVDIATSSNAHPIAGGGGAAAAEAIATATRRARAGKSLISWRLLFLRGDFLI